MALTGSDKIKIKKYLREHANGNIYYPDLCAYLCKPGKVTDHEFLDFFTECVIEEFSKDSKISIKQLAKFISCVGSFVEWMHEEGSEINEETLDKIRSFSSLYEEYLTRTGMKCDEVFRDNCVKEVMDVVNKLYPCETDSLGKYVLRVKELEGKIRELERTIDSLKLDNNKVQGDLDKANSNLDGLGEEISTVRGELREKKNYIKVLEKDLENLREQLHELETTITNITTEKDELLIYKSKCEDLVTKISELEQVVSAYNENEEKEKLQKEKEQQLESLIYQKLLVESASLDDLLEVIESKGITSDINEISKVLREMRKKVKIANGNFSSKPTYRIIKPKLMANGKFIVDVPSNCKHMDVMLVADFHISEFDSRVLNGFDMINNYCSKNGINLILNLGDFYHGFFGKTIDYESACKNYKAVEDSITSIPKADGIYHAVLGGNHERNIAIFGFDPIKMLTDERDDFIDLGYYHSTVCLDGNSGRLGKFDLHHPSNYDFPIDLDEEGLTVGSMNEYLDELYDKYDRSRDDSYIDIFGHTHRSQFNFASSYCYIPPFFDEKLKRGACHLRIYLDEETGIKYMVFMPLSVGNKLIKNNEIVYQKVLSR